MMNETKEKSPMISVIIPIYNAALYLKECLDSIILQSFSDIEIICVNDGSSDGSDEILKIYKERDNRIHIVTQDNQGLSVARNNGVKSATGKYLIFVDSDDWIEKDALNALYDKMERQQLEVCCFNAFAFGRDEGSAKKAGQKNRNYFSRVLDEDIVCSGLEVLLSLLKSHYYNAPVWTNMVLRSFYQEKDLSFYPGIIHEDEPWSFKMLLSANRVGCINKSLYHYRIRSKSITGSETSFQNAFGYYKGSELTLKCLEAIKHEEDPIKYADVMEYPLILLKSAINDYCLCTEEEKRRRYSLPIQELANFERIVVYNASLLDQMQMKEHELISSREAIHNLQLEKKNNRVQLKEAQDQIKEIRSSYAFRIGRRITWLPHKIKRQCILVGKKVKLIKRLGRRISSKEAKKIAEEKKQDNAYSGVLADDNKYLSTQLLIKESNQPMPDTSNELKKKVGWLLGTPVHDNIGDHLIAEAEIEYINSMSLLDYLYEITEQQLLTDFDNQTKRVGQNDILFLHGGGNLGNLWNVPEEIREKIIERFKNNIKIVFPQSIYFSEDKEGENASQRARTIYCGNNNVVLCCRDIYSYEYARKHFSCKLILIPDIVLWKKRKSSCQFERNGAMTLFRKDRESALPDESKIIIDRKLAQLFESLDQYDTVLPYGIDENHREVEIASFIDRIASVRLVITDRLHGMILCAITGTPCIVFGNNHHKIEGVYLWIKELKYIYFCHQIEELDQAIEQVMRVETCDYPENRMQELFMDLTKNIRDFQAENK